MLRRKGARKPAVRLGGMPIIHLEVLISVQQGRRHGQETHAKARQAKDARTIEDRMVNRRSRYLIELMEWPKINRAAAWIAVVIGA